jgi:excisionase family DNA binding protein
MATESNERPQGLIDIPTAAVRLGLSVSTVRRKIREGEVVGYRMGGPGTAIRIDPRELEAWLHKPESAA